MTDFDRWDVITALFPFTDMEVRKPRPILVLTESSFHRDHGHLIGSMITTASHSAWPSDYEIQTLAAAGLSHPSIVRLKIFTLPLDMIGQKIGRLDKVDQAKVSATFAALLP